MSYRVERGGIGGEITIPSSKSQTLRALLFASLAKGRSTIENPLASPDTEAMVHACRLLGATLSLYQDRIEVEGVAGKIACTEDVINAGNSGIVLRFLAAVGALSSHPVVITGDHSIRHHRPMRALLEGLEQLQVKTSTMRGDGFAPIIIQGPAKSGRVVIEGEDSQPVSALIILSSLLEGKTEIVVRNAGEKPWVEMTLKWLDRLGIAYTQNDLEHFFIEGGGYSGFHYSVPGDMSSAAFPISAALITGSDLIVNNADMEDLQGDRQLIAIFKKMGASIESDPSNKKIIVKKGKKLSGVTVDINSCIDALPALAVVAMFAEGETRICRASVARQKECNRIEAVVQELKKMGGEIEETEDGVLIRGGVLRGAPLFSYNDHRMAMALTVAAMGAEGITTIGPVECVSKTFPLFKESFTKLGAKIYDGK